MSSQAVGVQKRVKDLCKKAVYTHCCGHNLSLVVVSARNLLCHHFSKNCAYGFHHQEFYSAMEWLRHLFPVSNFFTQTSTHSSIYMMKNPAKILLSEQYFIQLRFAVSISLLLLRYPCLIPFYKFSFKNKSLHCNFVFVLKF